MSTITSPVRTNQIPTPLPRYHRLHKLVKKTITKLVLGEGEPSCLVLARGRQQLLLDIFERLCTSLIINTETPGHYSAENYVLPILDTTAELVTDPKVTYDHIQLNCCNVDEELLGDELAEDLADVFTLRLRSRLIISSSLMSCLDLGHCAKVRPKILRTSSRQEPLSPRSFPEVEFRDNYQIDFYSFAEMCHTEDKCKGRKGSVFTILAKDHANELLNSNEMEEKKEEEEEENEKKEEEKA